MDTRFVVKQLYTSMIKPGNPLKLDDVRIVLSERRTGDPGSVFAYSMAMFGASRAQLNERFGFWGVPKRTEFGPNSYFHVNDTELI